MCNKMSIPIFIVIFLMNCGNSLCFYVNFREFYGAQLEPFNTQMQKREMAQFFDTTAYSFNGLEKIESIPVPFPIDICILNLEGVKYAVSIHNNLNGVRHFTVYKNRNNKYDELFTSATPNAIAMDCKVYGSKGYIALAFNVTLPVENARDGSPIFELTSDGRVRAVQFFATTSLNSVYLHATVNNLYLLQTLHSSVEAPNAHCPYYKWSGTTFTRVGRIPCSNARHIETFAINENENYVAVANYADEFGRTSTESEIYKYEREQKRFELAQKIHTYGAVDVRYFSVPLDGMKMQHFLVFANSISRNKHTNSGAVEEADSVFYVFEEGQFVPYQSLPLYAVEQFLPMQNANAEKFLLLVACKDQETKIYNLNDWKFEQSNVQLTVGALGRGVQNMRIYEENDNSYLVIANEKMTANNTHIFLPIFKREENANALRQQIIDWSKTQTERLSRIDVSKLKQDIEQKLLQIPHSNISMEAKDIPESNIQTVTTNSFVYPKYHFTSDYWQALNFATQAVEALEAELTRSPNQRRRRATPTITAGSETEFANINVGTLVVKGNLRAQQVNGVDTARPTFERVRAKKVRVTGNYETANPIKRTADRMPDEEAPTMAAPMLAVKHLQINGHLNGCEWNDLLNYTLKRKGPQFVKQPVRIRNLTTNSVLALNDEINGHNLHKLIPIDGSDKSDGSTYVVNQSVLFEAPIKAKELLIHERLNEIHVNRGKLDVLVKRANTTQLLQGAKLFESVRVLQPIMMSGKISGSHLQHLSPQQIIHDNLILNGDFTINGNAIVAEFLSADDIIDQNSGTSTKHTLQNGLDITHRLDEVNIMFEQPLEANNTVITFINAVDLQQLIKLNSKELQILEGEKHFKQTLEIRNSFSEVEHLNGVDVENLTQHLLLKSGNQSIKVPMHFGQIQTPNITWEKLTLNDKPLEAYVTRRGRQHMPATLRVQQLTAQVLNVERMHTSGRRFSQAMMTSVQKAPLSATPYGAELLPPNHKFMNTIFVANLILNPGSINGRRIHDLEQQLHQLNANIQFVGNYKFNYDMNISELTFKGKLNDIPAAEFGRNWMQKTGVQLFTAPQSFARANCVKGLLLSGMLNGHLFDDFFANTYWINRNEYIDAIVFQNPIQMQAPLDTTTLNGLRVPLDILSANSPTPQILYANASVHGRVNLPSAGGIYNASTVNGVNLLALQQFLNGAYGDTLYVEHANFAQTPRYNTLNRHKLPLLLESAWLANDNVQLHQHIELADATFTGLLEFEGLVNNVNLQYLKENYLSLTRPQYVSTRLIFDGVVKFEDGLFANNVQLAGPLTESSSNLAINFNEFVANTLNTNGPHEVRASWNILSIMIQGDCENMQINNLNLAQDVVRLDNPYASITGPKRLKTARIQKLYATSKSTLNGVPVGDWIHDAVYVHGNHTIKGVTTLEAVNMNNDLRVMGAVNNISNFGEQTLLLRSRPQTICGDIHNNNLFPNEHRILTNNVENLDAQAVNDQELDTFYANVQQYDDGSVGVAKWKSTSSTPNGGPTSTELSEMQNWKKTAAGKKLVQLLKKSLEAPYYILDHFEVRQKLSINATKLVPLRLSMENGRTLDVIGIIDDRNRTTPVQYYQWSEKENQFLPFADYSWLPQKQLLVDLLPLFFGAGNSLPIAIQNRTAQYYQSMLSDLELYLENMFHGNERVPKLKPLILQGQRCFAAYKIPNSDLFKIYCLKQELGSKFGIYEKYTIPRKDIKEMHQITPQKIALLLADCVEIWSANSAFEFLQRLPFSHPTKIAFGESNNVTYLAIQSEMNTNTFYHGTIDIYSSVNATDFGHMQSFDSVDPLQLSFSKVTQTGDLLLHILSRAVDKSLTIYQYKGVLGFECILDTTILPTAQYMQILELEATKHIIALIRTGELVFVEIAFRAF